MEKSMLQVITSEFALSPYINFSLTNLLPKDKLQ